ncbi:MAG: Holliday junction ATP-dependent DNA helicase RuvA [Candidatus Poribacteria bacterium]|nr:Holliday junction ATP-dependent DNA helicase RuvA [Candidatus Poribacteria bacterium]
MIAHLNGTLAHIDSKEVVVDVNGVGYTVDVAERTLAELPSIGEPVTFYTHYSQNRENVIKIYGFTSRDALKIFELALTVKGVGPTLAQNIVTRLSPSQFVQAVLKENIPILRRVPRLSDDLAKLIIIKLKKNIAKIKLEEKFEVSGAASTHQAVINVLVNLGASDLEAEQALEKAQEALGDSAEREDLIREALRYIRN